MAATNISSLKSFVVSGVENEGHCAFFESRSVLWSSLCASDAFDRLLDSSSALFATEREKIDEQVKRGTLSRGEGSIVFRTAWGGLVHGSGSPADTAFALNVPPTDIDFMCITASVVRQVFLFLSKDICMGDDDDDDVAVDDMMTDANPMPTTSRPRPTTSRSSKRRIDMDTGIVASTSSANEPSTQQPDWGLHLIAGGCLGDMNNLLKRNRDKYDDYSTRKMVLRCISVPNEEKELNDLPVQQTSIDRGGLYSIRPSYLPFLRQLDAKIRLEFEDRKHGQDIVKVIDEKVNSDKGLLDDLVSLVDVEMEEEEGLGNIVLTTCKTLIRKYTHARIGGFLRGEYDSKMERMGGKSKGGASLRDNLYSLSGTGRGRRRGTADRGSRRGRGGRAARGERGGRAARGERGGERGERSRGGRGRGRGGERGGRGRRASRSRGTVERGTGSKGRRRGRGSRK